MGKKLVIPGADFSANAIEGGEVLIISSSQSDAGGYWKADGVFVNNISSIKGVAKISVPSGITKISFQSTNYSELEPSGITCWNNDAFLGFVPSSATVGIFNQLGTTEFILPTGTNSFSYVYKNQYGANNNNIELACVIVGR